MSPSAKAAVIFFLNGHYGLGEMQWSRNVYTLVVSVIVIVSFCEAFKTIPLTGKRYFPKKDSWNGETAATVSETACSRVVRRGSQW